MVDAGKIALTPAVELSYLSQQEQQDLLETMESEDCTPSLSQAVQLKKLSQSGELNMDKIFEILREPKANQQEKISRKKSAFGWRICVNSSQKPTASPGFRSGF